VILALLASVATEMVENSIMRERESELRLALRQIRGALDAYKAASDAGHITHSATASGFPPDLSVLEKGVVDARSPTPKKIFFLRRVPADPMGDPALGPVESWGLRSYASDAQNPTPGEDVYDVYSTSPKSGLNGVPYRLW